VIEKRPYWFDATPMPASHAATLPSAVDVAIIGAGYTGLSAARETAAAGLSTLVLEAQGIGAGCSSRNGGQVAYSIKPSFHALRARHGAELAARICALGREAVEQLRELATSGDLDCDWRECGSFLGAHTARHFRALVRESRRAAEPGTSPLQIVPRAELHREIATDFYHGGCVCPGDAAVDPARLLIGLWRRARASGAIVADHCPVRVLAREPGGFLLQTAGGAVRARRVLLATNGYGGALSDWHRRRVIPIGSYQIATEPLGAARMRELLPAGRNVGDTRRVVVYFRPSPDGERLLFGGRAALSEPDPLACVARLRAMMTQIFPQLRDVGVTHAWAGWVGYTFDTMPHVGSQDGLYHSMGYCGQGIPMAILLGRRVGAQLAERPEGRTALDDLPFPTRFFYRGTPWFLAPSIFFYRLLDRLGI
jgi:glycine/D-amino acid oxidase-like deaminating enzyme